LNAAHLICRNEEKENSNSIFFLANSQFAARPLPHKQKNIGQQIQVGFLLFFHYNLFEQK